MQTQSQTPDDTTTDPAPDIQPMDDRTTQTRPRESDLPLQGGVSPTDEPVAKRPMSSTQLSRRWERLSEGRYAPTPKRQNRPAEIPIEQHEQDSTQVSFQEPPPQPTPDLLLLPSDVPRSGRTDIEDIVIPSRPSSSSIVPVTAQPVLGSAVQTWLSQAKTEFLPSLSLIHI